MLKITGCILIFAACSGIGYLKGMELQKHLTEIQCLRGLFIMLRGEIKYTGEPLTEAFHHVGTRLSGNYGKWLLTLSENMKKKEGRNFMEMWKESIDGCLVHTNLKKSDREMLKNAGMNMGYLDGEMQTGTISLYLEQLETEIQCIQDSLAVRRRLCNCLGVMGGIFLVVILV